MLRKLVTTSVIFVSKSTGTPDFIPYREADSQIVPSQITDDLLKSAKIFHTTCFALSKDPARVAQFLKVPKSKAFRIKNEY
jgi:fructokinase